MMQIECVYAQAPRQVSEVCQSLPVGATVAEALELVGWLSLVKDAQSDLTLSIWGRKVSLDTLLRDGDRVEVSRPLRVDPKVARRERFQGQGARTAGLFSRRRPGSKSGY